LQLARGRFCLPHSVGHVRPVRLTTGVRTLLVLLGSVVLSAVLLTASPVSADDPPAALDAFLQLVESLPDEALLARGFRGSLSRRFLSIETLIELGNRRAAVQALGNLLRRLDGCDRSPSEAPDPDDWIVDCGSQREAAGLLSGLIDELTCTPDEACDSGQLGECAGGLTRCPDGTYGETICDAQKEPTEEICGNGLDEDCDGTADNPEVCLTCGDACDTGQAGVCGPGTVFCPNGEAGERVCQPFTGPTTEFCDGLDNDCNGAVDDMADIVTGIDEGLCQPEIASCVDGELVVVQERIDPVSEVCNDELDQDCDGADCITLAVTIDAPLSGLLTNQDAVDVVGSVSDGATSVSVNGVPAALTNGSFSALGLPLEEGTNLFTATAEGPGGSSGTASVVVVRDTTPPSATIELPLDGQIVGAGSVDVVGSVYDVVIGTVDAEDCRVVVDGPGGSRSAQVENRTFRVEGFPLVLGVNVLSAVATDTAGNTGAAFAVQVTQQALIGDRIVIASGDGQEAPIGEPLVELVVARAIDDQGSPLPGRSLLFRVTRNDGRLRLAGADDEQVELSVVTDANGEAAVEWFLGSRVGIANNRVEVRGDGFGTPALFTASGLAGACQTLVADMGANQVGLPDSPLARALEVVALDAGGNFCVGTPVTFSVAQGGGSFDGASEVEIATNADGRAAAIFSLGPEVGVNAHRAVATLEGLGGEPPSFVATAVAPSAGGETRFIGLVLDTEEGPLPDASVHIHGADPPVESATDETGQFILTGVPVGANLLVIDGSATSRPGSWPILEFQVNVLPGVDNSLGMPIFLPLLDDGGLREVGGDEDVVLELAGVEGFAIKVFANSATFADGNTTGLMGVTQVSSDQVPMPPNQGSAPAWAATLQPPGAILDPPAQITAPNATGLPPGAIVDIFSFDHDLEQFVSAGTGSVQPDGATIVSDPGSGIRKSGWHVAPPPPPPPACAAACGSLEKCENGACVLDEELAAQCAEEEAPVATSAKVALASAAAADFCGPCPLCHSNNGQGCVPDPAGTTCDDENPCTGDGTCAPGGECEPGNVRAMLTGSHTTDFTELVARCQKDSSVFRTLCEDSRFAQVEFKAGRNLSGVKIDRFRTNEVDLADLDFLDRQCTNGKRSWATNACEWLIHFTRERIECLPPNHDETCFGATGHPRGLDSMNQHRMALNIQERHSTQTNCPGQSNADTCQRLVYSKNGIPSSAAEIWLYPRGDSFANVNCTP